MLSCFNSNPCVVGVLCVVVYVVYGCCCGVCGVGEALQSRIEEVADVERCFVHLDYDYQQ
jgi:hypothetical protein